MPLVSIVIPAYNESPNLLPLYERLNEITSAMPTYTFEFLFVDDGSNDNTPFQLASLHLLDSRVRALRLSRNFGSHAACLAGVGEARGDYVMIMAADLQDPPELIPKMLAEMEGKADVVLAVRSRRQDPWLTIKFANIYHRLMRRYAVSSWPETGADVVMMRRSVCQAVLRWRQKNTSLFAQVMWTGFRQVSIPYDRQQRRAGESKWTVRKKIKLFVDSFVAFSFSPIRFISYSGMAVSALGFAYAVFIALNKLLIGQPIPGWSSLMIVLLLVSGFQLLMLGLIGEYLWRIADDVRGSPPFVVQARLGEGDSDSGDYWTDAVEQVNVSNSRNQ